jgi:predicted O-methyltransferase YrrM
LLYETVLKSKNKSPNIIEVGAFKGKSTCILSLAAARANKKVKSFELFSGLPVADSLLDDSFHQGQFSSAVGEYWHNIESDGNKHAVDLIVGDAREHLLPTIKDEGFCVAFIDVDVYEVTRDLFYQLLPLLRGGEVIIVHDVDSPGVRKAINEFIAKTKSFCVETQYELGKTSALRISHKLVNV